MYTYSIMQLKKDHFKERCEDIIDQYKRGVSTCPLFSMQLVPEGNPVWDKVSPLVEIYKKYRDALEPHGVKTGVLIQASLGHGYEIVPNPYQTMINFTDGESNRCVCPEDKEFIKHFSEVIRQIALARPSAIMLDDDFRLMMRPGRGCACPLHMAKFNKLSGTDMTREELYDYVRSHPDDDPLTMTFINIQRDSLINLAKELRDVIDSVDPTIQGINCTSGDECDSVIYTNPIFCGKGNPTIVRVPNGTYSPLSAKGFSDIMRRACVCSSKLKKHGIDIVLAETDTVPFNRYSKNARYLHAHYTASVLDGLMGAKHWLTRLSAFEPESGKEFRNILADHSKFYDSLSELAKEIKWVGANSYFIEQEHHSFSKDNIWQYHSNVWATSVFERMGIPFYFSDENSGSAFIEGDIVRDMTDDQIDGLFKGSVFASSDAAKDLCDRGYGHLLGVSVSQWNKGTVNGETFDGTLGFACQKQNKIKDLTPISENTKALSYNYQRVGGEAKLLSPAVTKFARDDGKLSVVYSGSPEAKHEYYEGFAFLNETRKKQFIELLKDANSLPVYYPGDNEICMRSGYINDGRLLCALFDLGYDPMDNISLYLEKEPSEIQILTKDGLYSDVSFEKASSDTYVVDTRVEPLYPVILLIKFK